ncbi:MAG: glycosyltransferase family 4 protein [Thiohalocapsa sp.]|jgi:UDP-N-acetylmuramyl pentapeptide phosphotransferase/UDP-N-acetylglucosamine-1-phosphate transferase|uniref:MraY family glycosyltransferase n=1 Tax=Thiohalocapsa sp. TaxID=2497641 RepID=UPI0025D6F87F|nr:glycosyltransferase family 4 protein [Thiohalocapsa sp.]MCG6941207.1 glycosyltransferase family 4 protein [Thiohalocapsa sp.]
MGLDALAVSAVAEGPPAPVLVVAPVVAFGVAFAVVWVLRRNLFGPLRILDEPNERSLHQAPVPRTGGAGVLLGVVVGLLVALPWWVGSLAGAFWPVLATALLAAVSLVDDRRHVPAPYRLTTQLLSALLLYTSGLAWSRLGLPGLEQQALPAWLIPPLTLAFVVWMTNLYNFMDGMDGLAGGMAVLGFGALAVLGFRAGAADFGLLAAVVAAAAGGFLLHNLPRAGIFLGDVGSAVLGFWAAGLVLWGAERGLFALWVGLLVFSPFLVDATWTLARRLLRGAAVWRAHREHHYQRLVLAGWTPRQTLLRAYVLMAAAAASAIGGQSLTVSEQWLLLLAWAGLYWLVHLRVELAERAGAGAAAER